MWYLTIKAVLLKAGFEEIESCFFKRGEVLIVLYVDDLLVFGKDGFSEIKKLLIDEFQEITVEETDVLNYLGMNVHFKKEKIVLSMSGYIKALLKDRKVETSTVPAGENIFSIDSGGKLIENKEGFHTVMAKLLYLSKRVRPDILLAVSFLCTRVNAPNEEDFRKLEKVLGYLSLTKDKALVISGDIDPSPKVEVFVDASFSTHDDGKGHTGCVIMLNGSMVYSQSRKQKICTKDSTEAEIVALSDSLVVIESMSKMIEKLFGVDKIIPTVFQDNQSAIKLVGESIGKPRTKHLTARLACVKEAAKEWKILFIKTIDMIADVLTKAKRRNEFHKMIAAIMVGSRANEIAPDLNSELMKKEEKKSSPSRSATTRVRWKDHGIKNTIMVHDRM